MKNELTKEKRKKIKIISIILLIIYAILNTYKVFQNDTFYLIKVGESLLKNGITYIDTFSIHGNLTYLYPHFLFSIVVYIFYHFMSFDGIYILTIIFSIIFSLTFYLVSDKLSNNKIMNFVFVLLTIHLMGNFLTLRSQIISYTIFILEYYFLYSLIKSNKSKYLIYIAIISILLANCHIAVYPFALILFLPFIGEYIINKIKKKETYKLKKLIIAFIIVLICGVISPLKLAGYTYLIKTLTNDTTNYIMEHMPSILAKNIPLIILVALDIFLFTYKELKLEIHEKFLLLGLLIMAFSSVRHISLLCIFTIIILNKNYGQYLLEKEPTINFKISNFITTTKGFIITTLLVIILSTNNIINNKKLSYIDEKTQPVHAVNYIKENLDYKNKRIFNYIDFGSYLVLNDIKVFVDSRTDLYTKKYNGTKDIYKDFVSTIFIEEYYEDMFEKYKIDYVLIPQNIELTVIMKHDSNYKIDYQDKRFIIFEKISEGDKNEIS